MLSGRPIDLEGIDKRALNGSPSDLRNIIKILATRVKLREKELLDLHVETREKLKRFEDVKLSEKDLKKIPAQRKGNHFYLQFMESVFEKNQQSAFPCPRPLFYNTAQQIWHEIQMTCEANGAKQFFEKMSLNKEYEKKHF
jgi:hypothetical protein